MRLVEERGMGMEVLSKLEDQGFPKPGFELEDNTLRTILFMRMSSESKA